MGSIVETIEKGKEQTSIAEIEKSGYSERDSAGSAKERVKERGR